MVGVGVGDGGGWVCGDVRRGGGGVGVVARDCGMRAPPRLGWQHPGGVLVRWWGVVALHLHTPRAPRVGYTAWTR